MKRSFSTLAACVILASSSFNSPAAVHGWLNWRGPEQNGTSRETGLPDTIKEEEALWTADYPGASTAAIANGRLYIMGYLGQGADLQEGITCFDAETGEKIWQRLYSDYLSDIIYSRYATSSPTVDPKTGNVYMQGTQGLLIGFTRDGEPLWKVPMMELYGRRTFPNGRTSSPVVDKDLVITRGITGNWGAHGRGGDRVYAFDKNTGELVWATWSGLKPSDSCYSRPYLTFLNGERVLITATGDGSIFCANARTGKPLWVIPMAHSGINSSVVVHNGDKVIAVYGTPYEPGQMVAMRIPKVAPEEGQPGPVMVERSQVEIWSQDISTFAGSPILVGDRVFVVAEKGTLHALDANTGEIFWSTQLGIEQRNSSPMFADGKLYVPMLEDPRAAEAGREAGTTGAFYVVDPENGKILSHTPLEGRCFGSPAVYNGKIYIQTTQKLYCFGKKGDNPGVPEPLNVEWPEPGPATQLQIIPAEVLLMQGQKQDFRVRTLDEKGYIVDEEVDPADVTWTAYIPPAARVRSKMDAEFNEQGELVAAKDAAVSAGAYEAAMDGMKGHFRGRVLQNLPMKVDFERFELTEMTDNAVEEPTPFAYPPLPWIGARMKFEVREKDGSKVLTKTIENKFFQRATVFIGPPELSNYTMQADVMTEGNRRKMSEVGLINQRYLIALMGNHQKLEVSSNMERLRVPAKTDPPNFRWKPNTWYVLKTRVDTKPDGSGVVKAKAWPKSEPEPEGWVIEVPLKTAHQQGAPGLYGFAPQGMRLHIDNILVTKNN